MKENGRFSIEYGIVILLVVSISLSGLSLVGVGKTDVSGLEHKISELSNQIKGGGENQLPPFEERAPIKIGTWQPTSGPLSAAGTTWLTAMKIWKDEINEKGGLPVNGVHRPVKIIQYNCGSKASAVPGIVTKLVNIDKVDILVSGYATVPTKPGIPIAMEADKLFVAAYATKGNEDQNYEKYISIICNGPNAYQAWQEDFLKVASEKGYKTVAGLYVNNEMCEGIYEAAPDVCEKYGLDLVYHKFYPPGTTSFDSMLRSIKAKDPDVIYFATYPTGTVNIVKSADAVGLKPKMIGGGMVGAQYTSIEKSLGPLLNGWTVHQTYVPQSTTEWPKTQKVLEEYQKRAETLKADPLGYYIAPAAYAGMEVVGEAIRETETLDSATLAEYIDTHVIKTAFGPLNFLREANGEWSKSRWLWTQYHDIKEGSVEEFKGPDVYTIIAPENMKSGEFIPYTEFE